MTTETVDASMSKRIDSKPEIGQVKSNITIPNMTMASDLLENLQDEEAMTP